MFGLEGWIRTSDFLLPRQAGWPLPYFQLFRNGRVRHLPGFVPVIDSPPETCLTIGHVAVLLFEVIDETFRSAVSFDDRETSNSH